MCKLTKFGSSEAISDWGADGGEVGGDKLERPVGGVAGKFGEVGFATWTS